MVGEWLSHKSHNSLHKVLHRQVIGFYIRAKDVLCPVKCGLDVSKDRFMTSYIFVELESSLETKKWSGVYGPLYEELPHVHLIIALDGDKLLKAVSVTWSHQRNALPCHA